MGEHTEIVEIKVVESRPKKTDVVLMEKSSMDTECKYLECTTTRKKSLQARYVYGLIFLLTNLMAWLIRDYGHTTYAVLHYLKACKVEERDCSRTNGVLRVSLGSFIFFLLMFLTTLNTRKLWEARSTWHSRWWTLKSVFLVTSLSIPFFCSSTFIHYYVYLYSTGEVARVGAGLFLLLQLVSVIQLISWWDTYWMPDSKLPQASLFGLFMSTVFYIASFCGIILMYFQYAQRPSCTLNLFFITWTAILFIVMMIISLHSKVNRGLLSSGIMASYIIFLCWSAIRSEPSNEKCSPASEVAGKGDWTTVLEFLIAICAIVMATFSTGSNSHSFQKNEVEVEDDIPYKYGYFHAVFSLGAMYFAMLFISWQLNHSTKKWSIDVGWASTWVKILNQWLAATIYLWKLISPVIRQDKVMHQEHTIPNRDYPTL